MVLDVVTPGVEPFLGVVAAPVVAWGSVVVGLVVPRGVAPGSAVLVVVVVVGMRVDAVGAVVTVVVRGAGALPEPPASLTRAAASTPSDSATTTASTAIGAFQLGEVASRVRAAAPQLRHHSCSG